jgi:hypothetical protein
MMNRALLVLKRDQYALIAREWDELAALQTQVKKGLENVKTGAEITFTIASILAGAGAVNAIRAARTAQALKTARDAAAMIKTVESVQSATSDTATAAITFHDAKLTGKSNSEAATTAAAQFAVGKAISGTGKRLTKAGAKSAVKASARDMSKNSVFGKKSAHAAAGKLTAAKLRLDLGVYTLKQTAKVKFGPQVKTLQDVEEDLFNNIWSTVKTVGGDS